MEKTKKMGRPRKDDAEKRTQYCCVNLTKLEREVLLIEAERYHTTLATYIRTKLFEQPITDANLPKRTI